MLCSQVQSYRSWYSKVSCVWKIWHNKINRWQTHSLSWQREKASCSASVTRTGITLFWLIQPHRITLPKQVGVEHTFSSPFNLCWKLCSICTHTASAQTIEVQKSYQIVYSTIIRPKKANSRGVTALKNKQRAENCLKYLTCVWVAVRFLTSASWLRGSRTSFSICSSCCISSDARRFSASPHTSIIFLLTHIGTTRG